MLEPANRVAGPWMSEQRTSPSVRGVAARRTWVSGKPLSRALSAESSESHETWWIPDHIMVLCAGSFGVFMPHFGSACFARYVDIV